MKALRIVAALAVLLALPSLSHAQWKSFGFYPSQGDAFIRFTEMTDSGVLVTFDMSTGGCPCDLSTFCYGNAGGIVEYMEVTNGDTSVEAIAIRLTRTVIGEGCMSLGYMDVTGFIPCFATPSDCYWDFLCSVNVPGQEWWFVAPTTGSTIVGPPGPGGSIFAAGSLSATDPSQAMVIGLSNAPVLSTTNLFYQLESLALPSSVDLSFLNGIDGTLYLGLAVPAEFFALSTTDLQGSASFIYSNPVPDTALIGLQLRLQCITAGGVPALQQSFLLSNAVTITIGC